MSEIEAEVVRALRTVVRQIDGGHPVGHDAFLAARRALKRYDAAQARGGYEAGPGNVAPLGGGWARIGGHVYAEDGTSDCRHGCGAWMGPTRSGAPKGVDPFGDCPKAPQPPTSDTPQ